MNYEEAKQHKASLEVAEIEASELLKPFPKGPMGLTPDDVKASPEFQSAKRGYDRAFAELRTFNGWFMKTFKKEYQADCRARHKARQR